MFNKDGLIYGSDLCNLVACLDSLFYIPDSQKDSINDFLYKYNENNDLMNLLFDVHSLAKEIIGNVFISMKLVEIFNYSLLGIFIQELSYIDSNKFKIFEDTLHDRHNDLELGRICISRGYMG